MATKIFEEGRYVGDVVKFEEPEYSRENVTVAKSNGKLEIGTVLEVGTDGKYKPLSYTAATTGENATPAKAGTPAAVLIQNIDTTEGDVRAVAIMRHAVVVEQELVFKFDDADVLPNVYADLKALGVIIRKGE